MFSKYVNYIIVIVISVLLALSLYTAGLQPWIVFTIIMIFTFVLTMGYPFYIIYKSRNLKLINRYLTNHRSKPIFGYAYALAHGTDEEVITSLQRVLKSYANAEVQQVYKANLYFHQKEWRNLVEFSKTMADPAYRNYYSGIGYTMNNNLERASECLAKLGTPWMVHSLKGIIAAKQKKREVFEKEMAVATKQAVGMQRHVLHYTLKRVAERTFSTKEV